MVSGQRSEQPLTREEVAKIEAAMARTALSEATKRLEDSGRGWAAGIGAVNGKVSVVMNDTADDYFAWDMSPQKARDFANALLAQADRAEGKEPS